METEKKPGASLASLWPAEKKTIPVMAQPAWQKKNWACQILPLASAARRDWIFFLAKTWAS